MTTPHTHKPHPYRKHEKGTACATCGNGRGHASHTDPEPWAQSACMKRPPLELTAQAPSEPREQKKGG